MCILEEIKTKIHCHDGVCSDEGKVGQIVLVELVKMWSAFHNSYRYFTAALDEAYSTIKAWNEDKARQDQKLHDVWLPTATLEQDESVLSFCFVV